MAKNYAIEGPLAPSSSTLTRVRPTIASTIPHGPCGPRWWLLELDAHGNIVDTTGGAALPTLAQLLAMPTRAPGIKAVVEVAQATPGASDGADVVREVVFDWVPGRYMFFGRAVSLTAAIEGPSWSFFEPGQGSYRTRAAATVVGRIKAAINPVGPDFERSGTGDGLHVAQFTAREFIAANANATIQIPGGARRVQIFDEVIWRWAAPALGNVSPIVSNVSERVRTPNTASITTGGTVAADRTAAAVFEVRL